MQTAARKASTQAMRAGARRDPEIYGIAAVTLGAFIGCGWYFGRHPTSAVSDEAGRNINISKDSAPWHAADEEIANSADKGNYKYKYHPNADYRREPKKAPSAVHSVVIPNVDLPKELHDKFNKYGKDNYNF